MTTRPRFAAAIATVALLTGCGGGHETVPVIGTVRLDGKPLVDARVSFQPKATSSGDLPGPGSMATTDADGNYELKLPDGTAGAVRGTHVVSISTLRQEETEEGIQTLAEERVPERYNIETTLEREVTVDGGGIHFDLEAE